MAQVIPQEIRWIKKRWQKRHKRWQYVTGKKGKDTRKTKKARSIASSLVAQFDRADAAVDEGGNGNNGRDEGTSTPAMK